MKVEKFTLDRLDKYEMGTCSVIQSDLNAGSIYCYFCALQFDNRCGWERKCSCFFLFFNSINNESTH